MIDMPTDMHWRVAFQIAPQLPADCDDAQVILSLLMLLIGIAYGERPALPEQQGPQLVSFPGGSKAPSRRASSIVKPPALPK